VYSRIASVLSPRPWLLTEAKPTVNSQCLGDNTLAIPSYRVNNPDHYNLLNYDNRLKSARAATIALNILVKCWLIFQWPFTWDDSQRSYWHLVNKGLFTWDDSKRSHGHLVNKWPFTWDDSQGSHKHFMNKGPFTWNDSQGSQRHFVNKWPFTFDDSQRSHRHFMNKGPFTWYDSQGPHRLTFANRPK
jgi:hypothetical protein